MPLPNSVTTDANQEQHLSITVAKVPILFILIFFVAISLGLWKMGEVLYKERESLVNWPLQANLLGTLGLFFVLVIFLVLLLSLNFKRKQQWGRVQRFHKRTRAKKTLQYTLLATPLIILFLLAIYNFLFPTGTTLAPDWQELFPANGSWFDYFPVVITFILLSAFFYGYIYAIYDTACLFKAASKHGWMVAVFDQDSYASGAAI